MNKLAKSVSLVLITAMLMLVIAACSNSNNESAPPSTAPSSQSSATPNPQSSEGDSDWKPQSDLSKKVKFSYASVQGIEGFDYNKGDALAQYFSDKFNYEMDVASLNWDNWSERLRIWINSGDMPDVAVYNYNHADAAAFVDQGMIKKFPDNWKTRWPNVAAVFDKTSIGPQMEHTFGGTYFIPRARFMNNLPGDPLPNHPSLFLRKDWAEAVGFPIKTTYTTSEVMEFAQKVKDQDPGKAGNKLIPIAENTTHAVDLFVARNSTHFNRFYMDTDGKYKWGGASEDTLKGLKLFSEAYRSGLLSQDFYTVKNEEHGSYFNVKGIAGATFFQAPTSALQQFYDDFQSNTGLDPYENLQMATVLGDDGNYHQYDLINYWGAIIFSPNIKDDVFERYMDILDYNATLAGNTILNMGIKDVDWTYESDGTTVKSLYDQAKEGKPLGGTSGKYPSMGYLLGSTILFDDFAFDNPNSDKRLRDLSKQLYTERTKVATPESFAKVNWDLFSFDSPNFRRAQMDYYTEYANIVTQSGDIETNWNNWVNSKKSIIQPVLDELNSKLGS
ncbi:putative aldouronate transport system substrate-binding protein [Paenibacillus castaneae]|uniref:ABC transporter substrate-binding protein n=1 Tax=Paenibacillus castaneae TaxID=474957 RepID=UPI000C9C4F3C|nr:ABC transporter substrate-binding protein [Paenibacillus castaneae]NIK76992.1 putative aldouronate transport system substrate-binding protein [Paenibacillus castaneae]